MSYWRLFYHLVWTTKERESLIDETVQTIIERSVRTTCRDCELPLHALGPMPDHIHLALSIPPRLAIADVARRLKGASSHAVNAALPDRDALFAWQAEYGVLSFGERNLPDIVAYVNHQRERHATNRLWPRLEQATNPDR